MIDLRHGHVLTVLRSLPSDSVDCVVTSPPYYGLRSYGTEPQLWGGDPLCEHEWETLLNAAKGIRHDAGMSGETLSAHSATRAPSRSERCALCGVWRGELGQEPTLALFIEHLVEIFREVRRVLKPSGTCWVNMGDSYNGSGGSGSLSGKQATHVGSRTKPSRRGGSGELPTKSRMMVPARLALALQDDGWLLRDEIVWHKPNAMPQSVKDRTTSSHEMIYLLAKGKRYYYNNDAIKTPFAPSSLTRAARANSGTVAPGQDARCGVCGPRLPNSYKGSMPGRKDGPGQDRRSKNDRTGQSFRKDLNANWDAAEANGTLPSGANARSVWSIPTQAYKDKHYAAFPMEIPRRCILAGSPPGGLVLDPFAGTGTAIACALSLGRKALGIELNAEYIDLILKRLSTAAPPLPL